MSRAAARSAELSRAAASPQLAARLTAELMGFIQAGRDRAEHDVVVLEPGVRLERTLNATHVGNYDALRTNHPFGTRLVSNRWSGCLLDLVGFGASYFGFAAAQQARHAASLAAKGFGLCAMEAEMTHYVRQPAPGGAPSRLEQGVERHGLKWLPGGGIDPLLGMSGSYVVRYELERPLRLVHLDFDSHTIADMFDRVGRQPKLQPLLPDGISLLSLLTADETRDIHLPYRAIATAYWQKSDFLQIRGFVASSFRAQTGDGNRAPKIVCIWGKDGELLRELRPVAISYFDFNGARPSEVYNQIGAGTDFAGLRRRATQ